MKRREHSKKLRMGEKTICLITIITWIVLVMIVLKQIDTSPATYDDYRPLIRTLDAAKNNPNIFKKENCNIKLSKGDKCITVELENEKCKIIAQCNEQFQIYEVKEESKHTPFGYALMIAGFSVALPASIIVYVVLMTLNKRMI